VIPVTPQPAPDNFDERVKTPGNTFLATVPKPKTEQWKGKEYWQKVLPNMRKAYSGICAYSAHWIPHSTGNHSIDHFTPKDKKPELAYEWSNFRYVASRFNSRKGTKNILDPFTLPPDWFILDFSSLLIKSNPSLSSDQKKRVNETISRKFGLNLNEDGLVTERFEWFCEYQNKGLPFFSHLKKKVPFIAYELQRQGLADQHGNVLSASVKICNTLIEV
jgi:hypothetical protein